MTGMTLWAVLAAVFIVALGVGGLIGYYRRQGTVRRLSDAVDREQRQRSAQARDHEQRLLEATQQLQQNYETQLAQQIERYQDRLEERVAAVSQEYEGRLAALQPQLSSGAVEQQLKQRYEYRLREAAEKIQQAYEQHLRQRLLHYRAVLQQEYEARLAEKIEYYEEQLELRLDQAEAKYLLPPSPLDIGEDTGEAPDPDTAEPQQMKALYEQKLAERIDSYQQEMLRRVEALEAEYAARLQALQQDPALAAEPSEAPAQDAQLSPISSSLVEEALEDVLAMEHAPALGEELELGEEDTGEVNLDELLLHNMDHSDSADDPDGLNAAG